MSLREVPDTMPWDEAWRLFTVLASDPSSHVAAAVAGWEHPTSWADLTLRDLVDVQIESKTKTKQKPYRRPWDKANKKVSPTFGGTTPMTIADFEALKASQFVNETQVDEETSDG